jgi:outer membrane protein TolC
VSALLSLLALPDDTAVPPLPLPRTSQPPTGNVPDSHPALEALRATQQRSRIESKLAELSLRPDVSIETSYGYRPKQTDMISVTASIELPLRRKQLVDPLVRAAAARGEAAAERIESTRRSLTQALAAARIRYEEDAVQLRFQDEVLTPQSQLALDSALASYGSGKGTFESVLAAGQTKLRLQLDSIDLRASQAKAVVDYDAILRGARSGASGASSTPSLTTMPSGSTPAAGTM